MSFLAWSVNELVRDILPLLHIFLTSLTAMSNIKYVLWGKMDKNKQTLWNLIRVGGLCCIRWYWIWIAFQSPCIYALHPRGLDFIYFHLRLSWTFMKCLFGVWYVKNKQKKQTFQLSEHGFWRMEHPFRPVEEATVKGRDEIEKIWWYTGKPFSATVPGHPKTSYGPQEYKLYIFVPVW